MRPIAVSLSRKTSLTMFSQARSAIVPAIGLELRIQPARASAQPEERSLADRASSARFGIGRVIVGADVVQLHVEDEDRRAAPLLERGRIGGFHGERRRRSGRRPRSSPAVRPPSRRCSAQELAATQPESRRQAPRLGENPILHLAAAPVFAGSEETPRWTRAASGSGRRWRAPGASRGPTRKP